MRKYLLLAVSWFVLGHCALAQVLDTTLELSQVVVRDTALRPVSLEEQLVSTEQLHSGKYFSLAEALQDEGLLFVKTYGLGSLATANVRGAAASQTSISWNDIPIQSPMLGLLDLSLLPVVQLDEVGINYNQAIGGNLFLRTNRPDTGLLILDGFTVGSFGQFQKSFAVQGGSRLRFKLSTQLDKARNDFPFQLNPNVPEKRQTNAELEQQVFQQSLFFQLSAKHQFELHLWQQATHRQLPPTSVATSSLAYQKDEVYRQQLRWKILGRKAVWQTSLAHLREDIFYADPTILLEAPSDFRSWILQTKRQASIGQNTTIETSLRAQRTTAVANGYAERGQQDLLYLGQSIVHQFAKTLKFSVNGEAQFTQGQRAAYGWRTEMGRDRADFSWQLSVHRHFRIPTLNDLLWIPGGSPQLRAESSLGQSLNVRKSWNKRGGQIRLELFNRNVDNWIQWAQRDDRPGWSAQNVTEVWSRGAQVRLDQPFQWGRLGGMFRTNYQWTRSTYQVAVVNPSIDAGEQLWYTPEHQGFVQLKLQYEMLQLSYTHRFVSESAGINDDLEGYDLGEVQLEYRPPNNTGNHIFLRVNNLWNTQYRIIERRPMPGQQWSMGYRVTIHP
ncbi:MAG: TonB-dependent receptor [Bacteroidota bacterium]